MSRILGLRLGKRVVFRIRYCIGSGAAATQCLAREMRSSCDETTLENNMLVESGRIGGGDCVGRRRSCLSHTLELRCVC